MLDIEAMWELQRKALEEIYKLPKPEKEAFQDLCSLATQDLLQEGARRNAPFNQVAINSYRNGIALGMGLKIEAGVLKARS